MTPGPFYADFCSSPTTSPQLDECYTIDTVSNDVTFFNWTVSFIKLYTLIGNPKPELEAPWYKFPEFSIPTPRRQSLFDSVTGALSRGVSVIVECIAQGEERLFDHE